jgi:F-type H+-transporting ATPase subunit delta
VRYSSSHYAKSLYELIEAAPKDGQNKVVSDFVQTLIRHNRLNLIRSIILDFEKVWYEKNGLVKVQVETAKPEDVSKLLKHSLGKDIEISEKVVPNLLGGARITVGDMRIDDTVRRRLSDLNTVLSS